MVFNPTLQPISTVVSLPVKSPARVEDLQTHMLLCGADTIKEMPCRQIGQRLHPLFSCVLPKISNGFALLRC